MKHNWVIEVVDGGYLGTCDVYHCTGCGCDGGATNIVDFSNGGIADSREPKPFLAGPAILLSEDCEEAHQQISFYVRGFLLALNLRALVLPRSDLQALCVDILQLANSCTPKEHPRNGLFQLAFKIGASTEMLNPQEVRNRLVGMGFKLANPKCSQCGDVNEQWPEEPKCQRCTYGDQLNPGSA